MRVFSILFAVATAAVVAQSSTVSAQDPRIARYQAFHAQIAQQLTRCNAEVSSTVTYRARMAMQGYVIPLPPCKANEAVLIGAASFLESQVFRIQNGYPPQTDFCDIVAIPGCIRRY